MKSQVKNSEESLSSTVGQIENKISGLKDKEDILQQSAEEKGKKMRKYKWNRQELWATIKRPNL
jgi:hypothetical protein